VSPIGERRNAERLFDRDQAEGHRS
jgi:hypothetical protein